MVFGEWLMSEAGGTQAIRRQRSGCLGRLALVLGSVLFTLVVLEAVIHLVEARTGPLFFGGLGNPEYNPRFVQPHPILGVEHKPNAVNHFAFREHPVGYIELRTNNLGLREDEETSVGKPPGLYRILVLGDSQTDGLAYNSESWPNVLERLLNEHAPRADGKRYEVLNAGVITYQPVHGYLWWRLYGLQLQPDLVILAYYVGNDLVDAGGGRLLREANGTWRLDEAPWPVRQGSTARQLLQQCRLCVLASYPLRGGPLEGLAARLGLVGSATEGQYLRAHRFCRGCVWQSLHQARLLEGNPAKYQADLAATEEILHRLRDEVEEAGAKFLVAVIPSKLQIEGDASGRAAQVAQILKMSLPNPPFEDQVEADVVALCRRNGIPVVNVRPTLEAAFMGTNRSLYYEVDWHLGVEGNGLVGGALFEGLRLGSG